jgi:peptidoglycan/LPS O-acetylase OafA/YrhL
MGSLPPLVFRGNELVFYPTLIFAFHAAIESRYISITGAEIDPRDFGKTASRPTTGLQPPHAFCLTRRQMPSNASVLTEEAAPAHSFSAPQEEHACLQISNGLRIAELDGLRGIAAVSVVIAHYFGEVKHGLPGLAVGWIGVDLFFVLSGFLIGSIILERKKSPRFLRTFYSRRGLRIIPVYLLTLGFVMCFLAFSRPAPWIDESLPALPYFTFTQNIVMAARGQYGTLWLLPTWTLAVEEQFYLIIPLLMIVLPSRYLLTAILGGIAMACGVRALFYRAGWGEIGAQVLLVSRCDILLCGVLAAYIHKRFVVHEMTLRLIPVAAVLGTLLAAVNLRLTQGSLFFVFSPLLMAILFAAYIMLAARGWEMLRSLNSAGWRFFGSISYGLYLVHQPVAGAMHGLIFGGRPDIGSPAQVAVTLAAMLASIGIAWGSWKFFEAPLLRLGKRLQYD